MSTDVAQATPFVLAGVTLVSWVARLGPVVSPAAWFFARPSRGAARSPALRKAIIDRFWC
ncbi:hypothetical protein [Actinomadura sp. NTSP31]|uniref:hypothetical protein n=1 Tax=Actinomadura sp. NTSP31 TaxID=1735447 RepID=UPI0035C213F6